jgi:hypothetical protein
VCASASGSGQKDGIENFVFSETEDLVLWAEDAALQIL